MKRSGWRLPVLSCLVLACVGAAISCKSAPTAEAPVSAPPAFESKPKPAERVDETGGFKEVQPVVEGVKEMPSTLAEKLNAQGVLKRIYFDFDKFDLKPESIPTLGANADRMKENGQLNVRIEGHCDERGTVEYNLALGEKRARTARDYLVSRGIPAQRLSIISYGKERPLDPGHSEAAWAMNRRDEFVFLAE